jgi:hypothetical protein
MERQFRVVRKAGEWSCRLGCSMAASVGDGESASRVTGAWGASPADGSSALASSRPRWRVSTAALLKACWRWSSGRPAVGGVWLPVMTGGPWKLEDSGCRDSKDYLVISSFFRDLCAFCSDKLSSVSSVIISVFVRVHVRYP